ncbi:MAG: hypothetical protein KGJ13_11165, partial [Patescibacteria group bacterium]|nr:hypothetical protein [Patescibacteria group bacterium]
MSLKKIVKYLLITAAFAAVIWIVVYFLTRNNQPENQTGQLGQTGTLPSTAGVGGTPGQGTSGAAQTGATPGGQNLPAKTLSSLILFSNEPTLDYFIDGHGNGTIIEPDGEIATIANKNADVVSSLKIQKIIGAGFSYDGTELLVNFGDANNPQTSVFDVRTKSWTPLPVGMISPRWSPFDYRIAYLQNNADGTKTLTTLDASKTKNNSTAIITLHIQDISLRWLSKNKMLLYDAPSIYTFGSVWALDLQKKSINPVITEQRGLEAAWSNATATMGITLTGNTSQYGGQLQLVDGSGNKTERLGFLTFPQKCLFNQFPDLATSSTTLAAATATTATSTKMPSSTVSAAAIPSTASSSYLALYCGVPRNQNALSYGKLPDDYNQMALFTSDDIYRINTS